MDKTRFKELLKVNLRYANPQQTTKNREKGKSGASLTRSLVMQYFYSGLLFLLIYGFTMLGLDFSQLPGYFTYYMALFGIIAFSQGISVTYNIFFQSQDLPNFLPLPFRQSELFLSKIAVAILTITPLVLPVFVLFIFAGIRSNIFILWAIVGAILLFSCFLGVIFSICSFIVFGLAKTKLFKRHKQLMTSILLIVSVVIAVLGILVMNWQTTQTQMMVSDRPAIGFLLPFFYAITQPLTTNGLLSLFGLVGGVALLVILFRQLLLPKLYEQLLVVSAESTSTKRKHKTNQNLRQVLFNYHVQLIRNPSLLMQVVLNSVILPLVFIASFGFNGGIDLSAMGIQFLGVAFLGGFALAMIMINQTSLIANVISLDKENFLFIQTLPLSLKVYLKEKFRFAYLLQLTLISVVIVIVGVVFHMPLLHLISALCGGLIGCYLMGLRYFRRDYRLLLVNWTEINQLFSRGTGNLGLVFTMIGTVFLSTILLVMYSFALMFLSVLGVNLVVGIVFISGSFLWYHHYQKHFWQTFE
ncbi:permease component of an ABC superfamily transporter [Tetragenococcus muriaticus PMC-11-5]|uniref:Permease component of an ABC superfamily transporter n=2 Tax=Tetragenococcus muriaticus TaxID=64642 RepID=A0A091C1S7_9ENTE|nr:ABC transporter [Tetragenococcus muriaticus]KFN90007.1 permease component of an ABC superfamily transporter [Tetragenococcus muriaticus PMC-11-5]GMA47862.1 ABC transporter [Tetragenococcus muriaticus]